MINNGDEIVVFLGLKLFNSDNSCFSCSGNAQVTFMEKPLFKNPFSKIWTLIYNSYLIIQRYLGYHVNRGLSSLRFQSLQIWIFFQISNWRMVDWNLYGLRNVTLNLFNIEDLKIHQKRCSTKQNSNWVWDLSVLILKFIPIFK